MPLSIIPTTSAAKDPKMGILTRLVPWRYGDRALLEKEDVAAKPEDYPWHARPALGGALPLTGMSLSD
jgi:hypothetical protein